MDFDGLSKVLGQVAYLAKQVEEFAFELQGTLDQMRKSDESEPVEKEPFDAGVSDDAKLDFIANNHPALAHLKEAMLHNYDMRADLKSNKLWMDSAYTQALTAFSYKMNSSHDF